MINKECITYKYWGYNYEFPSMFYCFLTYACRVYVKTYCILFKPRLGVHPTLFTSPSGDSCTLFCFSACISLGD